VEELVNSDDTTAFNFAENCIQPHFQNTLANCTILLTESQCAHELEKTQLLLQERDKEIENLKSQIVQLQDIVTLLKNKIGG
jgi:hypothetical protein